MATDSQQFMNENDLNRVKGLCHYLNESFGLPGEASMAVEVKLSDSNGEPLGAVDYHDESERYVFFYGT